MTILYRHVHVALRARDHIIMSHDMLSQHNQETAQLLPDPFPSERVGSGHKTIC